MILLDVKILEQDIIAIIQDQNGKQDTGAVDNGVLEQK
jgi:hypothetical protein